MGINQNGNTSGNNLIYSKETRYKLRKQEFILQKELQDLDYKICNPEFETLDQNVLVEYEAAR